MSDRPPPRTGGWAVSPAFDLLFLCNVGWVLALLPGYLADDGTPHLEFWQVYFVTTPHRWLTLLLVALDPDRREGRGRLFLSLALLTAAGIALVHICADGFLCLAMVDYLWNGWHFASQHAGVLCVYSRKAGGGWPRLERHGLRLFLCYTIARTAGWATGWLEGWPAGARLLGAADLGMLAVPALLVGLELTARPLRPAKACYLASVCGLYGSLLWSLHVNSRSLVLALTTAAALFHATEYLAVVTHYARGRRQEGSGGFFRALANHWLLALAGYVVVLGLFAALAQGMEGLPPWWLGLNLWASFLHYAYDGMIWKLRRPATARALGAEPATG